MKRFFVLFFIITVNASAQQLPMYSQYMFNMMNINPAYAGFRNTGNVTMLYRNQWNKIPGAPITGNISYDSRLENQNHGWGVQAYFDRLGIENRSGVQGNYSFKASFKKSALHVGISAGLLNYNTNFRQTNPFDAGDPALTTNLRAFIPTFGAGIIYETEKWYAALSLPSFFKTRLLDINDPRVQIAGNEAHYFLTAGYIHKMDEDLVLRPSVLVKAVSGAPLQYDLNLNLWLGEKFAIGASYRSTDALLGLAELQVHSRLRLGYAYDYTLSEIGNYSRGNHELMLRFDVGRVDENVKRKYF